MIIFGGSTESGLTNTIQSFNFETNLWSDLKTKGKLPAPRSG
jgi:hypothetical protein